MKQKKVHIFCKREIGPYQDGLSIMWPGFVLGPRQFKVPMK